MDYSYNQTIYDEITNDLFFSSFVINATIYIQGKEVVVDSNYGGISDNLDGRVDEPVQINYPQDMPRIVRVKAFPVEKPYNRYEKYSSIQFGAGAQYEPYDRWISCLVSDIEVLNSKTYFDFAKQIEIKRMRYRIKGKVKEEFGIKPILHVFLVKETNE